MTPRASRLPATPALPAVRPGIYWVDLLVSVAVGGSLFGVATSWPAGSPGSLLATLGAVLAWLRAVTFVHEIAHRAREVRGFEPVWNLLVGIPMGVPSLLYVDSHRGHHRTRQFGTPADPEYARIGRWSTLRRLAFVAASALVPLLLAFRWGVLGPLSALCPPLRRLTVGRLSTLAINPRYVRAAPRGGERRRWLALETGAALFVWAVALATLAGALPGALVAHWLSVVGGVFVVNQLRTIMAHRYALQGAPVDASTQLLDSVTLPEGSPIAALIAPLGLRFHALHHWAPGIPYHDLGRAHRRLRAEAGTDDAYARTLEPDLGAALRTSLRA